MLHFSLAKEWCSANQMIVSAGQPTSCNKEGQAGGQSVPCTKERKRRVRYYFSPQCCQGKVSEAHYQVIIANGLYLSVRQWINEASATAS